MADRLTVRLLIVAVGHKMSPWTEEGFSEYVKRMPSELRIELREIKPEQRSGSRIAATVMQLEAARIEAALPRGCHMTVSDERGKDLTIAVLAESLTGWQQEGGDIMFVIGDADGLDPALKVKTCTLIRLSSLTLPYGTVRVLLAEQPYCVWSITQNYPYHRV